MLSLTLFLGQAHQFKTEQAVPTLSDARKAHQKTPAHFERYVSAISKLIETFIINRNIPVQKM
jgi:hypothetical protein